MNPLHIDIPVTTLAEVDVAIHCPRPWHSKGTSGVYLPPSAHRDDIADWKRQAQVYAVFHTNRYT